MKSYCDTEWKVLQGFDDKDILNRNQNDETLPNFIKRKHPKKEREISTGAQYVTLDNKIKCLSLAVIFLGNLTNKTVFAYMWGLLIANHLDQSL
jgi:hypothetical protein